MVSLAAGPSVIANVRDDNRLVRPAAATFDQPVFPCSEPIVPRRRHVEARCRISERELGRFGSHDRLGDPPAAHRLHARIPP